MWAVSLAFWVTLLLAAVLYASVALAPRLFAWMVVRHDYLSNAHQLEALEQEVDYLERVRDTLQTDPEFVRKLASAAIAEDVGDSEVIPVSGTLIFGGDDQLQSRLPEIQDPFGASVVRRFASDRQLRHTLLGAAIMLVVFAFTVLNGTGGWFVRVVTQTTVAVAHTSVARYRRDEFPAEDDSV